MSSIRLRLLFYRMSKWLWLVKPPPRHTKGFQTVTFDLVGHYDDHVLQNGEFPEVKNMEEYLFLADDFWGRRADNVKILECQRRNAVGQPSDTIRYNTVTEEYGVRSRFGVIRTHFIADPTRHRRPTNLDYFRWDCARVK